MTKFAATVVICFHFAVHRSLGHVCRRTSQRRVGNGIKPTAEKSRSAFLYIYHSFSCCFTLRPDSFPPDVFSESNLCQSTWEGWEGSFTPPGSALSELGPECRLSEAPVREAGRRASSTPMVQTAAPPLPLCVQSHPEDKGPLPDFSFLHKSSPLLCVADIQGKGPINALYITHVI